MKKIKCDNFFVMRTPSLPVTDYFSWEGDDEQLTNTLENWLEYPKVREALYLSSPSLLSRIPIWKKDPNSKQGKKIGCALLKYYIRMHCRPTPFGLFAGISKGEFSHTTDLCCLPWEEDKRKTRLDMLYLSGIRDYLSLEENITKHTVVKSNTTLYHSGHRTLRYIESYQSGNALNYQLSEAETDEYLDSILELTNKGITLNVLVDKFSDAYPLIARDDIRQYVEDLLSEKILILDMPLPLTAEEPSSHLVKSLSMSGLMKYSSVLHSVVDTLQDFDTKTHVSTESYSEVVDKLKALPFPLNPTKLIQVDTERNFSSKLLSRDIADSIETACSLLAGVTHEAANPLKNFITQFQRRYEGRFVPLNKVLDDESGITFGSEKGYESPLLAGIPLSVSSANGKALESTPLDDLLLKKLCRRGAFAEEEIYLDRKELEKCARPGKTELPVSFGVQASLFETGDEKETLVHFQGCYGPSAANFLGRFCHLDKDLTKKVREHLQREENSRPEAIFAEVIHLPDGRPGNVISRPKLRNHEIVFLADSDLDENFQIQPKELFVYVENNRVRLWSKRLGKEVIPRMSCAHNFNANSLGIYKFLCQIQQQNIQLPQFIWPKALSVAEVLPRVKLGNIILSPRTWNLQRKLFIELEKMTKSQFTEQVNRFLSKYDLPENVVFSLHDNALTLNLRSAKCLQVLLSETQGLDTVKLQESLNHIYSPLVKEQSDSVKRYANEVHFLCMNQEKKGVGSVPESTATFSEPSQEKRRFMPGNEWLSLHIYGGNSDVENLLTKHLSPLIKTMQKENLFSNWFFIRYSDPDWHLRLRFRGEPKTLLSRVLPAVSEVLCSLTEVDKLAHFTVAPYEREIERYGGDATIAIAESLFEVCSETTLKVLSQIDMHGESLRWRAAIMISDSVLSSFGYELTDKLSLISRLRRAFGKEFSETSALRKILGRKYRELSGFLHSDLSRDNSFPVNYPPSELFSIVQSHEKSVSVFSSKLLSLSGDETIISKDELLASLLHMQLNRIFRAYNRQHEFVVYDFLRRYYLSTQTLTTNN
ncbi:lantibiotic dehydratase [Photobacterium sp. 2_MG-2023]|uniref:lantibiotic dehydratase n=1 Tax=Photobacterium sp. 2_MG-2023 TaxID=3062663 RepID=UPI0026E41175|nr:lantibiotic dehydratase [Photobacterium sp. 2_MG-2023]MDO6581035.1 lantibiotic dehydratase [Photobacterium sp. 2_MG-2023]